MRPKALTNFELLGWAATGTGMLSVLIMLVQAVSQRPGPGAATYLLFLFILLLFGALGMMVFYAAKRRHEVGRWGFIVVGAVIGILLLNRINGMALGGDGMGLLYLILDVATLAALMAGTICLAQPEMQGWFAQGPIMPPPPAPAAPYPAYPAPQPGAAYPPAPNYPPAVPEQPQAYPPQAPAAPLPAAAEGTRRCPYCAEEIRVEASKCRHCGSAVDPLAG